MFVESIKISRKAVKTHRDWPFLLDSDIPENVCFVVLVRWYFVEYFGKSHFSDMPPLS